MLIIQLSNEFILLVGGGKYQLKCRVHHGVSKAGTPVIDNFSWEYATMEDALLKYRQCLIWLGYDKEKILSHYKQIQKMSDDMSIYIDQKEQPKEFKKVLSIFEN